MASKIGWSVIPGVLLLLMPFVCLYAFQQMKCKQPLHLDAHQLQYRAEKREPLLMAHRLSPLPHQPENAVSTLLATWKRFPCALFEMDVRTSRDSVLMMLHDSTLERTTTGTGTIASHTYSELRKLQLRDGRGDILHEHIPTLEEMLVAARGKCPCMLDVKPGTSVDAVMELVSRFKMDKQVVVIIYSLQAAIDFHKKYPDIMMAIGFNSDQHVTAIQQSGIPYNRLIALTPQAIQPREFYGRIHQMGILTSVSLFGSIDALPFDQATEKYNLAIKAGGDILCSDSLHNVITVWNR
jgi:glycerophosphoryl diester phosphodiesterase